MTPEQFLDALQRLGLKQADYARLIDVNPKTVWMWASGRTSIPKLAAEHLTLLLELDDMHRRFVRGLLPGAAVAVDTATQGDQTEVPPTRLAAFLDQPDDATPTSTAATTHQG